MPGAELAAALVDVAIGVGAMVAHLFISVLWASARPWRYVCSREYRLTVEQQFAAQGSIYRWLHLCWGTIALLLSVAVIYAAVLLAISIHSSHLAEQQAARERREELRREAVDKAKGFIKEKLSPQ